LEKEHMSHIQITVPDIGLESEEIKFGSWLKSIGETVEPGEDLFEIEADKATVVCESPASGTLAEITVSGGEVRTGDVIGYLNAG
jgi:pyruvate/2-oxoglutarate dehydrogenase complex dihydrolipoamide acyltransferase (E2) component